MGIKARRDDQSFKKAHLEFVLGRNSSPRLLDTRSSHETAYRLNKSWRGFMRKFQMIKPGLSTASNERRLLASILVVLIECPP